MDAMIPIRNKVDILEDVRGIVKLGVRWEEYHRPHRALLTPPRPKHPAAAKREKTRQKTLARKRAEAQRQNPPDPSEVLERMLITKVPELTCGSDCPVPLTGVYSKDCYADGHEKDWLLVTTHPDSTTLDSNAQLRLSHRPRLPPGPVRVTIRVAAAVGSQRGLADVIRELAAEQRSRGFPGRSASDLRTEEDAGLAEDAERDQELDAAAGPHRGGRECCTTWTPSSSS